MRRALISLTSLTFVWFALWGSLSWGNLFGGIGAAAFAIWMLPSRKDSAPIGFRPFAAVRLVVYFLWRLAVATAIVAWETVTPRDRTSPAIVAVRLASEHPTLITAVANMVSLTPGTLTLDIETNPATLYIHVLHFESTERTQTDIDTLVEFMVAALPPLRLPATPEVTHG